MLPRRERVLCSASSRREGRPPFGARNSVFGFGGASRAIEWLLTLGLGVVVTHYADDYPHLEPFALGDAGVDTFKAIMKELGWRLRPLKPTGFAGLRGEGAWRAQRDACGAVEVARACGESADARGRCG